MNDGKHKCPVVSCDVRLPRQILMCKPHWYDAVAAIQ